MFFSSRRGYPKTPELTLKTRRQISDVLLSAELVSRVGSQQLHASAAAVASAAATAAAATTVATSCCCFCRRCCRAAGKRPEEKKSKAGSALVQGSNKQYECYDVEPASLCEYM